MQRLEVDKVTENRATNRVMVYVDGFNLYFGLRAKGWKSYYWLNVQALAQSILKPNQTLVNVKYFTSRVSGPLEKAKRQNTYLEALGTLHPFVIHYGKYMLAPRICRKCGYRDLIPTEKMTDVNIATEIMVDAFQDQFDTAILVSADSDLKRPIENTKRLFPNKKVVVAFPPERSSKELKQTAHGYFSIGRDKLAKSVFPDEVKKADGFILKRPERWTHEVKDNVSQK